MTYSRDDVETHGLGYGYDSAPAANVKVYFPHGPEWRQLAHRVACDFSEDTANAFADWIEAQDDPDPDGFYFQAACSDAWEQLLEDVNAENVFGRALGDCRGKFNGLSTGLRLQSEGRSGGWAVVSGLPDVDQWDAIALARWRKFERFARETADDVPYQMLSLIYLNVWEFHLERQREQNLEVLRSVGVL